MCVIGIASNLVTYLVGKLHFSNADKANIVTNLMGTLYLLCFLGEFIADSLLGRLKRIAIFGTIQALGLARSMPMSGALDLVANKLNLPFFEVPTGWKFFGNLMDAGKLSICREESFGNGSDHVHEKDGIWNKDKKHGERLVSIEDVAKEHWATYGQNFFARYDYEECESDGAKKMVEHLRDLLSKTKSGEKYGSYGLKFGDDFSYTDPISLKGNILLIYSVHMILEY